MGEGSCEEPCACRARAWGTNLPGHPGRAAGSSRGSLPARGAAGRAAGALPWVLRCCPPAWWGLGLATTVVEQGQFPTHVAEPGLRGAAGGTGDAASRCRGVLGSLSPSGDLSPPWEVSQHDVPILRALCAILQPHHRTCPDRPCWSDRSCPKPPAPKPPQLGLISLDVPQGARVRGPAAGADGWPDPAQLPPALRWEPGSLLRSWGRSPPMYCILIFFFRCLRTNAPRSRGAGGKRRTMVQRVGRPAARRRAGGLPVPCGGSPPIALF